MTARLDDRDLAEPTRLHASALLVLLTLLWLPLMMLGMAVVEATR